MSKKKLIITQDGVTNTRVGHIKGKAIKYKESIKVNVELEVGQDYLRVKRMGEVDIEFTHKLGECKKAYYEVCVNGQTFTGDVLIETTHLLITDDVIELNYLRDGDVSSLKIEIIT